LKVKIPGGKEYKRIKQLLHSTHLHTICEEAKCPNLSECFGQGTATFLILGDICTRNCRYCHVTHSIPDPLNQKEPDEIAKSVEVLGLSHVVITSVTRDDLEDGGADIFVRTIQKIRKTTPDCTIEVLTPDFNGDLVSLQNILDAAPDVFNHNIEVVKELFPTIRPDGDYEQSISLLDHAKKYKKEIITKSGFMVGLGETQDQITRMLYDLNNAQVDVLTIGQYLQPSKHHVPVQRYYSPREFDLLKNKALQIGFSYIEAGPLVRSSYRAEHALHHVRYI
jgi:lipoyl synthase